ILVAVALMVFERAVPPGNVAMVDNSRSAAVFARMQGAITDALPADAPNWIVERYEELVGSCTATHT
ncbi:MAG TPA: CvpA family protein, partial [Paracoccus sp.]|nr:CvpA family protein [Paracoccus sp. (in: a-proteobacteria)]